MNSRSAVSASSSDDVLRLLLFALLPPPLLLLLLLLVVVVHRCAQYSNANSAEWNKVDASFHTACRRRVRPLRPMLDDGEFIMISSSSLLLYEHACRNRSVVCRAAFSLMSLMDSVVDDVDLYWCFYWESSKSSLHLRVYFCFFILSYNVMSACGAPSV